MYNPRHSAPGKRRVIRYPSRTGSSSTSIRSVALLLVFACACISPHSPQLAAAQTTTPALVLSWSSSALATTSSVAWGDYDNDGDLDLAVGNSGAPIWLYRNDGGKLTVNPIWFSNDGLYPSTSGVAWGDVDGDGDLDLVAGAGTFQPNRLYRNNGGVLTSTAVWISTDGGAGSVAWGDVDRDGDLDLAVGNRLYRNNGGVLTNTAVWISTDGGAGSVAWGDIDGDGDLDLAVGNRLYRNDGGVLTNTAVWSATDSGGGSTAWGDVDGDGDLDLAVGNRLYRTDGGVLTSTAVWASVETDDTTSVAWGDVDNDGDVDLAVGYNQFTVQSSRLYRNDGGVLTSSAIWSSPETDSTNSVAWGDMDGDGDLDLAVGNRGPNRVYRNDNSGLTADPIWSSAETEDGTSSVAWGDVDGDNDLDLILGNYNPNQLYRNENGQMTAAAVWSVGGANANEAVAWGDVDSDGDLDLAIGISDGATTSVYRNNGGVVTPSAIWSSADEDQTLSVAWGDVDGDGDLDLAVGNLDKPNRLYRNDGGILTSTAIWSSVETSTGQSVAWGDVDGDGDLDLAVGNRSQSSRLYRNDGGILTSTAVWSSAEADGATSVAWGDVDGDGDVDLAVGGDGPPTRLYCNVDGKLVSIACWSSIAANITDSVAWGDMDGDGDLDLAVGNRGVPNKLYRNDNGVLTTSTVWTPAISDFTTSVAWGDVDGDGDIDLAVSSLTQPNKVYRNQRRTRVSGLDNPPYVTIPRPGITKDANFFSSPQIMQTATVPISYKLFDPEGDTVTKIFPEFSPNGGGQWLPATPGAGGDGTRNLSAFANGTSHTFVWQVDADLIKNDNVVFRIRAQPSYRVGPILWPALDGKSPSFRVAAPWYIKVVDESGNPIRNATIYMNGKPLGSANQSGLLKVSSLPIGQTLVALSPPLATQATARAAHNGWAYRTHLSNLSWSNDGTSHAFTVTKPGEQRLVVQHNSPLVLFNLVVSLEWAATSAERQQLASAFQSASRYLYDLTDGQMAIQQVAIYDNAEHWADADIQFAATNIVRPHAYVGGITSSDTSHVIRVGRGWDGQSGNQGAWDQPDGYRTLVHEFGHYALHLYDEYIGYEFDAQNNLVGELSAGCTELPSPNPATSASAMYDQYHNSELAMKGVSGLWSAACEGTAQWQLNRNPTTGAGESDWETLIREYADTQQPARWQFTTPRSRGQALAGPEASAWPVALPAWPQISLPAATPAAPPRTLTVLGPQGPYKGAIVALYKQAPGQSGRVLSQGFTDAQGRLNLYGASSGDVVRAASLDAGIAGNLTVDTSASLTLQMQPIHGVKAQVANASKIPQIQIVAEPSATPGQVALIVGLEQFDAGATPVVVLTAPGSDVAQTPQLSFSQTTGKYSGQMQVSANTRGTGRIQVVGSVAGRIVYLQTTFRVQQVASSQTQDLFADDGNLQLHVGPGSVPGNAAYLVIEPTGTLPGSTPTGLTVVGQVYQLSASGAVAQLEQPGVLTLHIDRLVSGAGGAPIGVGLYHWDPNSQTWQVVASRMEGEHQAVVASIRTLGTYALLAPVNQPRVFLPTMRRP